MIDPSSHDVSAQASQYNEGQLPAYKKHYLHAYIFLHFGQKPHYKSEGTLMATIRITPPLNYAVLYSLSLFRVLLQPLGCSGSRVSESPTTHEPLYPHGQSVGVYCCILPSE